MQRHGPVNEEATQDGDNWGRWGMDDQLGAVNLVTPAKRAQAARLVRSGRAVTLSRPFPKDPAPNNPRPAQHFVKRVDRESGGAASDYYGISYHGRVCTHLDALCHMWGPRGAWNGTDPDSYFTPDGCTWGGVEQWKDGIVTRGVLLDVPRFRGTPYVTGDHPVEGSELSQVARAAGISLEPGDAIVVYSGRDAYDTDNPDKPWGSEDPRPGLDASCLSFLQEADCSMLVWDMMDAEPHTVHGAIFTLGLALVDDAELGPLARACADESTFEFMLIVAPLNVEGGTGSPVNPIALF